MKFLVFNNKNGLGTADKLIVNWDSVKYIKPVNVNFFEIHLNNGGFLGFNLPGGQPEQAVEAIYRVVKANPNSRVLEVKPRSLTEFTFSSITYTENTTSLGYKALAMLVTQTGTNTPTFTILKNDFPSSNTFNFTRFNAGGYRLGGAGTPAPFTANKTVISCFNNGAGNNFAAPPQAIVYTVTGTSFIDFVVGADNVLTNAFFEIRVYD